MMSALSIVSALTIMGGATYAAFSGSATATNNTFATGNADLQIALDTGNNTEVFGSNIAGPTFTGILPGQTKTFNFWLKNNSTTPIGLDVTADVSGIDPADDNSQVIDNTLLVSWTCDTNGNNSLGDETPTPEFSPRDWLNGGNASLFLNLGSGVQRFCQMTGRLPSSADNTVAGQSVAFDVKYDGSQVAAP